MIAAEPSCDELRKYALDALVTEIAVLDPSGTIVLVNSAWRNFAAANSLAMRDDGVGSNYLAVCERADGPYRDEAPAVLAGILGVMTGGINSYELEYPCHSPDEERWFIVRVTPLSGNAAPPYHVAIAHEDITVRKQSDRERERFFALAENGPAFVGIADPDGHVAYVNPAGRALVGLSDVAAVPGTRIIDYFPPALQPRVATEILPVVLRDGRWSGELPCRNFRTGEWIPVYWNIFTIRDPATSDVLGIACISPDLRDRKRAERERDRAIELAEEARHAAETANRAKSDFLANLSHELRTPLNALGGYADLMLMGVRGAITEEQRTDLERMKRSQQYLLGLINDILNFARVSEHHVDYEIAPVELHALLAGVEEFISPQMTAKGLRYDYSGCDSSLIVKVDADKLRQILVNLLTNALKFTHRDGSVSVSCTPAADGRVGITVTDTGIGIPGSRLESIFSPFVQLDRSNSRTLEGIGLGLSISRDIARAMNGDVTVTSTVGKGSSFTVTLPLA